MPKSNPASRQWRYEPSAKVQSWQLDRQDYVHDQENRGFGKSTADLQQFDVAGIESALREKIQGEVRFDDGSRALYATDGSNYRQTPIGIVIPKHVEDVINAIAICREFDAPVLARGGGTSLAGQCCNVAVVLDMSKYMNQVVEIDPKKALARVQPGTILDDLRHAAEKHRLTFGPDPATHNHCTLGGMIGNNSCGIHAQMAGRTADNIHELDILLYDGTRMRVGPTSERELERIIREGGRRGEIYRQLKSLRDRYGDLIRERYPKIPRRVSGYNLDELLPENGFNVARALVGSEGTCVTILEATTCLVDSRPKRTLVALGYDSVYEAGDHVPLIRKFSPVGLEGLDDVLISHAIKKGLHTEDIPLLPSGKGWLLVEFGADTKIAADAQAKAMMAALKVLPDSPTMKLFENPKEEKDVWEVRESGLGATARVPGLKDTWPGWEDSAVPPDKVGDYLRDLRDLYEKHGYKNVALYGHFGQGCIHCRVPFDLTTNAGLRNYRSFMSEAVDLVLSYGGSLSGEHGDGQARAEFLPRMFGPELMEAFTEFKTIWDPLWKMNPGKVIHPYSVDQNLRLGTDYSPKPVKTYFQFPEDKGFADATLRCVGIGKCRRLEPEGTMCPSFMATREEKHSTRGRAHLLNEMLRGDIVKEGWKSEAVKEALDLCLSCKGCKGDCPVNVDMATYKAEFLAHYFKSHARPRAAYSMGWIDVWARIGSRFPSLVNFFSQTPVLRSFVKTLGGIDLRRSLPRFADVTFRDWFLARNPRNEGQPKVMLWPDTFNNYFHPETAAAAVEVLEAAGFQVIIPESHVCCGRPLYDYGFLDRARDYLHRTLDDLRPQIRTGIPIVMLEPSCFSVFQDELKNMLPYDLDGRRLRDQTYQFAEFLEEKVPTFEIPTLRAKAVVHGHCHHKSLFKMKNEQSVLDRMGLKADCLDSGCCGMAGSFGFESTKDHYEVSLKCGERVLLPAIRDADGGDLVVADGFSCKTQIQQNTAREALHVAQVIHLALKRGPYGADAKLPERRYLREMRARFFKPTLISSLLHALFRNPFGGNHDVQQG